MRPRRKVLVVGSGVNGLTCAVLLVESGYAVRVVAARPPAETTSASAGAMWTPHQVGPSGRVMAWSRRAYQEFAALSASGEAGVRVLTGMNAARCLVENPFGAGGPERVRRCGRHELPDGYVDGYRFAAPVIDMPVYLAYLTQRLWRAGVRIELATLRSLAEVSGEAPIVVNCSGLGARELVPDSALYGVRGELVVMTNPGIGEFFAEIGEVSGEMVYIYPHSGTVVLGGIAQEDEDPAHRAAVTDAIIDRCLAVEPRLAAAEIIEYRVGVRPVRPQVRLELEHRHGLAVIHNYGHGGAGVSMSWGCATEVADLAARVGI